MLALPVHLAAVATLPGALLGCQPATLVLFLVGRALFARGYAGGAGARALGFALTFYPTVALLLLTAGSVLTAWMP